MKKLLGSCIDAEYTDTFMHAALSEVQYLVVYKEDADITVTQHETRVSLNRVQFAKHKYTVFSLFYSQLGDF